MHLHHEASTNLSVCGNRAAPRHRRFCKAFSLVFFILIVISLSPQQALAENHYVFTECTTSAKVNIIPGCNLQSSGLLSFPDLDPSLGDVHAVYNLPFRCTLGSSYRITMDMGKFEAGGSRRMKHESRDIYISYNLSIDKDYGTGTGRKNYSWHILQGDVYSKDFTGAALGNYSDTVIITITPSVW